jgi:hypothetical protein
MADGLAGWIKNGFELDYIPQITVQDFISSSYGNKSRIESLYWTYASPEKSRAGQSRTRCVSRLGN